MVLKSVYQFKHYRTYLGHYYDYQKQASSGFSYAQFAEKAQLPSPNYLQMVIKGRRNLTIENIHRFADALELETGEREFFEALVLFDQAELERVKTYYGERLERLKLHQPESSASTRSNALFSEWYHPVVWVAAEGKTRQQMVEIGRTMHLQPTQIESALDQLKKDGLLTEDGKGNTFELVVEHLQSRDSRSVKVLQKEYLGKQLDLSKWAWRYRYGKEGVFLSHTFTLDVDDYAQFSAQMGDFLSTLVAQADKKKSNNISQINMQMFSLSGLDLNKLLKKPGGHS